MVDPEISIVMPAYMAQETVRPAVIDLVTVLEVINLEYEIIVVIDGNVDKSKEELEKLSHPRVKILELSSNMGKGCALRLGINSANGSRYIGFVDADLDISPKALSDAFGHLESCLDTSLVVGSKLHPESIIEYPYIRRVQSYIFANLVNLIFRFGINDTQTGLKLGRSKIMKEASSATLMNGFAYDLELLMRAKKLGGRFTAIPIELQYRFESTISPRKYLETFWDVIRVIGLSLWR